MTITTTELNLIRDFIRFDTTSRNSNLDLINWVANRLDDVGLPPIISYSPDGTKANLLATIGPDAPGAIVLSGHTDTVPVDGQIWATNPYEVTEKDGKLHGRGTVDMKSFDALALAKFEGLARDHGYGKKLSRPLHLLLTYDEEVGCLGAQRFVDTQKDTIIDPSLILVGEPTRLQAVIANKGIRCFNSYATGKSCHSSRPDDGVNAIRVNARLLGYIYRIGEKLKNAGVQDLRFDPPYSTVNVGTIKGGSAINIVADECVFSFETRPVPGDSGNQLVEKYKAAQEKVLKCLQNSAGTADLRLEEYVSVPSYAGDDQHEGTQFLISQLDNKETAVAPFCTEAGVFQNAGWNTVVCGPGSIAQAHQPDEYITLDQLARGAALINRVVQRCLPSAP